MPEYFDPNATGEAVALQRGIRRRRGPRFRRGVRNRATRRAWKTAARKAGTLPSKSATRACSSRWSSRASMLADKELLAERLREQGALLTRLQERLEQMELENSGLRQANADLREVVTSLKIANEQMQTEVEEMDKKLRLQDRGVQPDGLGLQPQPRLRDHGQVRARTADFDADAGGSQHPTDVHRRVHAPRERGGGRQADPGAVGSGRRLREVDASNATLHR